MPNWVCQTCTYTAKAPAVQKGAAPACPNGSAHRLRWTADADGAPTTIGPSIEEMDRANPCQAPRSFAVTGASTTYNINITITKDVWETLPNEEKDKVLSILNATPISVSPDLKFRGNGIKRESIGWCIHTQSDKSLFDRSMSSMTSANPTDLVFNTYRKRPH